MNPTAPPRGHGKSWVFDEGPEGEYERNLPQLQKPHEDLQHHRYTLKSSVHTGAKKKTAVLNLVVSHPGQN